MFCISSHNRWIRLTVKYSSKAYYHNHFKKLKKFGRMASGSFNNQDKGETLIRRFEKEKREFENIRFWMPERGVGQIMTTNNDMKFTLMNYNILAQDLLDGHPSLYRYHDPYALPWAYRYDRLMFEINNLKPEILCVQELQENCLKQFTAGLANLDYDFVYKKRTGGSKTDGCGIFFNKKLFDLVEYHDVEYYQPNIEVLNRENVALICKLCLKSNPNETLVVATTHLLFNPRRQDIRLAQVQVLLAELDRLACVERLSNGKNKYCPSIVCGDFNLQPYSAPYELITNGFVQFDNLSFKRLETSEEMSHQEFDLHGQQLLPSSLGITDNCQHATCIHDIRDKTMLHHSNKKNVFPTPFNMKQMFMQNAFNKGFLQHNFDFESVYKHKLDTDDPEASTYQQAWITVDYIFYSGSQNNANNSTNDSKLQLLSKWSLPNLRHLNQVRIPNLYYGSDHFSLAAKFLLKSTA